MRVSLGIRRFAVRTTSYNQASYRPGTDTAVKCASLTDTTLKLEEKKKCCCSRPSTLSHTHIHTHTQNWKPNEAVILDTKPGNYPNK